MKALSAREMIILALVGWSSALVMLFAALRMGGALKWVAVCWILGAVVWTFMTGLRLAREAMDRDPDK
jgi:hypothetical protein